MLHDFSACIEYTDLHYCDLVQIKMLFYTTMRPNGQGQLVVVVIVAVVLVVIVAVIVGFY